MLRMYLRQSCLRWADLLFFNPIIYRICEKKNLLSKILFNIHILVWNADDFDCAFCYAVKYYVTARPETAVAFLYFISCSSKHWIVRKPSHSFP
ncbi:hypothetical protein SAMN05216414_102164 [Nitrosovibrio sp. Nv17]|nr:hypothetical protein SAMN05216414_102164 [Nitrosovibrio sp. Nv17]